MDQKDFSTLKAGSGSCFPGLSDISITHWSEQKDLHPLSQIVTQKLQI